MISPNSAEVGYLAAAVPAHLGGWGLDLAQMAASQRRLARYAPATALAMSMHTYWVGIAAELERAGDSSLRWMLDAALDGEVFAAGHAEAGNDIPVLLSTCRAERVDGGYRPDRPQAVRLERPGVDVARSSCHGRRRARRSADRARLRRAHQPWRDRRGDLGHPRHATDPEPRHDPRRGLRARRPHRAGRPGRRRHATRSSWRWRCGRCR